MREKESDMNSVLTLELLVNGAEIPSFFLSVRTGPKHKLDGDRSLEYPPGFDTLSDEAGWDNTERVRSRPLERRLRTPLPVWCGPELHHFWVR